jgi:hypothetical protein
MGSFTNGASDLLTDKRVSLRQPSDPSSSTEHASSMNPDTLKFSVTREAGTHTPSHPSPTSQPKSSRGHGNIDPSLLREATAIVDSIDPANSYESTLHLASLSGRLMKMWETASDSSSYHQDILATLENAILSLRQGDTPCVTQDHLKVFREALIDLAQPHLVSRHVVIVQSQFLAAGFAPLSFLDMPGGNTHDDD